MAQGECSQPRPRIPARSLVRRGSPTPPKRATVGLRVLESTLNRATHRQGDATLTGAGCSRETCGRAPGRGQRPSPNHESRLVRRGSPTPPKRATVGLRVLESTLNRATHRQGDATLTGAGCSRENLRSGPRAGSETLAQLVRDPRLTTARAQLFCRSRRRDIGWARNSARLRSRL
jgi:hypothetical protein